MKNFFLSLILIALASFLLQLFLPWWVIAPVAFVVTYLVKQNGLSAFFAGFLAIFIMWVAYAYKLSSANEHLLAGKVAEVLKQLTGGSLSTLFLLTGLIGGLVAGFAGLSGAMAQGLRAK